MKKKAFEINLDLARSMVRNSEVLADDNVKEIQMTIRSCYGQEITLKQAKQLQKILKDNFYAYDSSWYESEEDVLDAVEWDTNLPDLDRIAIKKGKKTYRVAWKLELI